MPQAGDLHVQIVKCRGAARIKALRAQVFPAHWNTPLAAVSSRSEPALAMPQPLAKAGPVQLSLV